MPSELVAILIAAGGLLTVGAVVPYLIAVVKGKTKPRVVTWFIWSVLTGIAATASLSDGQIPTAVFLSFATLGTFSVVVLGWKHGDRKFERIDIVCFIAAIIGIILWQVFNNPALAVIATITIDLIGGIPTLIHAAKKPHEETAITFFLCFLGASLALIAVQNWQITSVAYPIFLVTMNFILANLIFFGQRLRKPLD